MILVTGGTGLVGSHLILELLKSGKKVQAIHRKNSDLEAVKAVFLNDIPPAEAQFLFDQINWLEASLDDIPALTRAFKGITKVYHCAALVSFDPTDGERLRKINIEGTANIVNLCIAKKVEKLCYISSIATMDLSPGEKEVTENFTWHPEKNHTDYAISKHGAEIEVWRGSQEGLPVVILNPGIILGPGFWDKGTGQIFRKIDKGLKFHFPKVTGFVGVHDVSTAAVLAMDSIVENEQFIIVAENQSFKSVFLKAADSLGKKRPHIPLKPWMVKIGWIYQTIASIVTGSKKIINRGDHKSLFETTIYSNEKFKREFKYEFSPINLVIDRTAAVYKKENL